MPTSVHNGTPANSGTSVENQNALKRLKTSFIVKMNGDEKFMSVKFYDMFWTNKTGEFEELDDDDAIKKIYMKILKKSLNDMAMDYKPSQRRILQRLNPFGNIDKEFYDALSYNKGNEYFTIERNENTNHGIVRDIKECLSDYLGI